MKDVINNGPNPIKVLGVLALAALGHMQYGTTGALAVALLSLLMIAFLDTPILYLAVYYFRQLFNLEVGEEIDLDG